jgi:hypothetical protein
MITTEYLDHVTVLKSFNGHYYAAVMIWNSHDEMYYPTWRSPLMSRKQAEQVAEEKAAEMKMKVVGRYHASTKAV